MPVNRGHLKSVGTDLHTAFNAEGLALRQYDDPDKAFVMSNIARLVKTGQARCLELDNGELQLTFRSGEVFHLRESSILRVS